MFKSFPLGESEKEIATQSKYFRTVECESRSNLAPELGGLRLIMLGEVA